MQAGISLTKTLDRPEWLPHEEWPFDSRVIEVDGHRIHLIDEGGGPVLLFVHAGLWSFLWRDVIIRLRSNYRCIALDFPGSGLSEKTPSFEPALLNNSRILESVVDALALEDRTSR
jgi:haloalkane dehalogenase